jgi:peptide/nickel transport system substrate-binding protein
MKISYTINKKFGISVLAMMLITVMMLGAALPAYAQGQPQYGGTLRVLYVQDPTTLNGLIKYWTFTRYINMLVLNKLLKYDKDFKVVGDLAESWSHSDDSKVWTFKLRNNVYWHDGVKFTSADVKFHYDQIMIFKPYLYILLSGYGLKSIETPDDYTVVFRFDKFASELAFGLAGNGAGDGILPKHIFEVGNMTTNPHNWMMIGTGPYKVDEYQRDKDIILSANDKYFGGKPYIDKIIFTFQRDSSAALLALEAGDVDMVHERPGVPLPEVERVNKIPGLTAGGYPFHVTWRLTVNWRDAAAAKYPWIGDIRVRQAISMAIDRDTIVQKVLGGFSMPSYGPVSPLSKAYYCDECLTKNAFDLAKANALFDQAGYKRGSDGVRFRFPLIGYQSAMDSGIFQSIQQQLRQVGIEVEMKPIEDTVFFSTYEIGPGAKDGLADYPLALNTMIGGPEPDNMNWLVTTPPAGENSGFYPGRNGTVSQLWEKIKATNDKTIRKQAIDEIQRIVTEDVGFIFLWHESNVFAWNSRLQNVLESMRPVGYQSPTGLSTVWWAPEATATTSAATSSAATTTPTGPAAGPDMPTIVAAIAVIAVVVIGAAVAMRRKKKT